MKYIKTYENLLKGKPKEDVLKYLKFKEGDLVLFNGKVGLVLNYFWYNSDWREPEYSVYVRSMDGDIIGALESELTLWNPINDDKNDLSAYKSIASKNDYKINIPEIIEDED